MIATAPAPRVLPAGSFHVAIVCEGCRGPSVGVDCHKGGASTYTYGPYADGPVLNRRVLCRECRQKGGAA